jgi:hypothetical protein
MEEVIAIIMVFGTAMVGIVSFSQIGRAIAARIRGPVELPAEEVEELRERVAGLARQVAELAERQDFAERLLTQARERGRLGSGGQG